MFGYESNESEPLFSILNMAMNQTTYWDDHIYLNYSNSYNISPTYFSYFTL